MYRIRYFQGTGSAKDLFCADLPPVDPRTLMNTVLEVLFPGEKPYEISKKAVGIMLALKAIADSAADVEIRDFSGGPNWITCEKISVM